MAAKRVKAFDGIGPAFSANITIDRASHTQVTSLAAPSLATKRENHMKTLQLTNRGTLRETRTKNRLADETAVRLCVAYWQQVRFVPLVNHVCANVSARNQPETLSANFS